VTLPSCVDACKFFAQPWPKLPVEASYRLWDWSTAAARRRDAIARNVRTFEKGAHIIARRAKNRPIPLGQFPNPRNVLSHVDDILLGGGAKASPRHTGTAFFVKVQTVVALKLKSKIHHRLVTLLANPRNKRLILYPGLTIFLDGV